MVIRSPINNAPVGDSVCEQRPQDELLLWQQTEGGDLRRVTARDAERVGSEGNGCVLHRAMLPTVTHVGLLPESSRAVSPGGACAGCC